MVPAGNKAKRLSSVNHTTKTIHHQGYTKGLSVKAFFGTSCCSRLRLKVVYFIYFKFIYFLMDALVQLKKTVGYKAKECQTFTIKNNWRSPNFDFLGKKIWKKVPAISGETFVLALSSSAVFCLQIRVSDFFLICFSPEVKGFYQSSFENEVDFTILMNVSPNILAKN